MIWRTCIRCFGIFTCIVILSCRSEQFTGAEKGSVVGTIYRIGNDPFTKLALQTSDGTVYILHSSKELESVLNSNQGKTLTVYYHGKKQSQEGCILNIIKIENSPNR